VRAPCLLGAVLAIGACGRLRFEAEPDAIGPPFCSTLQPPPTFCSDFEDGTTSVWDGQLLNGGTLDVDAAAAHSSHFGLHLTTPALAAGMTADPGVDKQLAITASRVTLAFDLFVEPGQGSGDVVIAEVAMDDGSEVHAVEYVYRAPPKQAYIEDSVTPNGGQQMYDNYAFVAPPMREWHRLQLDVTTGPGAQCTVTMDGASILQTTITGTTGGTPKLQAGVPYLKGPASAWAIDVDNVVLDIQ
jgi:hypothetical protein